MALPTIQFKTSSGATAQTFDIIEVLSLAGKRDETEYSDLSHEDKKIVHAKHLRWEVKFGLLSDSQISYLNQLEDEEAPQMIYAAVTYNIFVERSSVKRKDGSMTVWKREAE